MAGSFWQKAGCQDAMAVRPDKDGAVAADRDKKKEPSDEGIIGQKTATGERLQERVADAERKTKKKR